MIGHSEIGNNDITSHWGRLGRLGVWCKDLMDSDTTAIVKLNTDMV